MPKLPLPPADLAAGGIRADKYRDVGTETLWWRIHRVTGAAVTPWNRLRHYGPVDARFGPHPPPPGDHPESAVWYAAAAPSTAFAEVFHRTRTVPLTAAYHLTALHLSRPVRLLDITGDNGHGAWATRVGAPMALSTGRHDYASAGARAICDAFPHLEGLAYRAAMEGGLSISLFLPAEDAMPTEAVTSRALSDPAMAARIAEICDAIDYRLASRHA